MRWISWCSNGIREGHLEGWLNSSRTLSRLMHVICLSLWNNVCNLSSSINRKNIAGFKNIVSYSKKSDVININVIDWKFLVDLLSQVTPFPEYPSLQLHTNEPFVLIHWAFWWQLSDWKTHSSTSVKYQQNNYKIYRLVLKNNILAFLKKIWHWKEKWWKPQEMLTSNSLTKQARWPKLWKMLEVQLQVAWI